MKTSELIAAVGDDKVGVQFLDQCFIDLNWDHKKGTRITFGTDVKVLFNEGTERMGMVVWMDRDAVAAALAKAKEPVDPDAAEARVELVARAIAEKGFGRPWDDFEDVNAFDTDHSDLLDYARAAMTALSRIPDIQIKGAA